MLTARMACTREVGCVDPEIGMKPILARTDHQNASSGRACTSQVSTMDQLSLIDTHLEKATSLMNNCRRARHQTSARIYRISARQHTGVQQEHVQHPPLDRRVRRNL